MNFQPLECRFCHHEHTGLGQGCHLDIEKEWNTRDGQTVVIKWGNLIGLWERLNKLNNEDIVKDYKYRKLCITTIGDTEVTKKVYEKPYFQLSKEID